MKEQLQKKVNAAIRLLQSISKAYDGKEIEVAYSGGKDSDVILELTKMAGIPYRAIYKNTTIDPPGTIKHVKEMGVEIHQPREGKRFFELVEHRGYPSRFVRFCCSELKEYKILDKCIMGIRTEESQARKKRYLEPTGCRFYGSKKEHVEAIYPILNWTLEDVKEFIEERQLKLAPVYYDEDGTFHPERRLGCIACPMAYKTKRIAEFKQYPSILKQYISRGRKFFEQHPNCKTAINYHGDVYEYFTRCLFYDSDAEMRKHDGLFGRPDFKAFLEDYFKVKL